MMIKAQEEIDVGVKSWRRQEGMGSSLQWGDWIGSYGLSPKKRQRALLDLGTVRRFSSPMISSIFSVRVK